MTDTPVTIKHLTAENIKRLRIVEVTPEGNLIIVGGDNEQGKSSLLDSIEMLLNGGRAIPDQPVRRGRDKGFIVGDLSNGLHIERRFTAKGGTSLVITDADQNVVSSPQTLLDRMKGLLTFDPLAFATAKAADQRTILMELVGLDFSEQAAKRAALFAERGDVNKTIRLLSSQIRDEHPDTPTEEVDVMAAVSELKAIAGTAAEKKDAKAVFDRAVYDANTAERIVAEAKAHQGIAQQQAVVKEAEEQLAQAKAQLEQVKVDHETRIEHAQKTLLERLKTSAAAEKAYANIPEPDTARIDALNAAIESSQAVNQRVRDNRERAERLEKITAYQKQVANLQRAMDDLDDDKAEQLRKAKFPIEGLAFDDQAVTLNGLPFNQASSAERLKVSVAMGLAMNPELKILLIRDGSLLDASSKAAIATMAAEAGGQLWVECVSKDAECQIIIEDGMVMADADRDKG